MNNMHFPNIKFPSPFHQSSGSDPMEAFVRSGIKSFVDSLQAMVQDKMPKPPISLPENPAKKINAKKVAGPSTDESIPYDELAYNLSIMKQTIAEGNGAKIDLGFIEIFHNDLAALRCAKANSVAIKELTQSLEEQEQAIYRAKFGPSPVVKKAPVAPVAPTKKEAPIVKKAPVAPVVSAKKVVPKKIVENKQSLKLLAESYAKCPVKEGLLKLHKEGFSYRPVVGDGHCLFRSVATAFVLDFVQNGKMAQDRFLDNFVKDIRSLDSFQVTQMGKDFVSLLGDVQAKRKTADSLITDQKTSDFLVSFLRQLATSYNRKFGGKEFAAALASISDMSSNKYLDDMADMQKRAFGGEPEIAALAKCLRKRIQILDAHAIGQGEKVNSPATLYGKSIGDPISLLHRLNHYDVACK